MALLVALVTSGAQPAATMAAPGTSAADNSATVAPEVHVKVRMLADVKAVQAGHPFKLGVELVMDPGWHTYYKECGDAGMPTKIKWNLPPGFSASELLWLKAESLQRRWHYYLWLPGQNADRREYYTSCNIDGWRSTEIRCRSDLVVL